MEWEYVAGVVEKTQYLRKYISKTINAELEVVTKRRYGMPVGDGETFYFLRGYKEEFRSEAEMMDFFNNLDEVSKRRLTKAILNRER